MFDSSITPPMPAVPTQFTFTEQAAYEKGFSGYFNEKVKPVLQQLDQQKIDIEA